MIERNLINKKGIPKTRRECLVLDQEWTAHGLPVPEKEYRFHPVRKWRFDYAYPGEKIAIEIEGIFFRKGQGVSRHQTGIGYAKDAEKYNAAASLGWVVLRYVSARGRAKINWEEVKRVCNERNDTND